ATARVEVAADIYENIRAWTIAGLDVQRRKASRHSTVAKTGERIDGIKLISFSRDQSAAKGGIKEIFSAYCKRQGLVWLRRSGNTLTRFRSLRRGAADVFCGALREVA